MSAEYDVHHVGRQKYILGLCLVNKLCANDMPHLQTSLGQNPIMILQPDPPAPSIPFIRHHHSPGGTALTYKPSSLLITVAGIGTLEATL